MRRLRALLAGLAAALAPIPAPAIARPPPPRRRDAGLWAAAGPATRRAATTVARLLAAGSAARSPRAGAVALLAVARTATAQTSDPTAQPTAQPTDTPTVSFEPTSLSPWDSVVQPFPCEEPENLVPLQFLLTEAKKNGDVGDVCEGDQLASTNDNCVFEIDRLIIATGEYEKVYAFPENFGNILFNNFALLNILGTKDSYAYIGAAGPNEDDGGVIGPPNDGFYKLWRFDKNTAEAIDTCDDTDGAFHGSECLLRVDFEVYSGTIPGYGSYGNGNRHPGKPFAATFVDDTFYYSEGARYTSSINYVTDLYTKTPTFVRHSDADGGTTLGLEAPSFYIDYSLIGTAVGDFATLVESPLYPEQIRDGKKEATYLIGIVPWGDKGDNDFNHRLFVARILSGQVKPESYAVLEGPGGFTTTGSSDEVGCVNWFGAIEYYSDPTNTPLTTDGWETGPPIKPPPFLQQLHGSAYAYDDFIDPPRLGFSANNGRDGIFELSFPITIPDGCWNTGAPGTTDVNAAPSHKLCTFNNTRTLQTSFDPDYMVAGAFGPGEYVPSDGTEKTDCTFELAWRAGSAKTGNNDGSVCPTYRAPEFNFEPSPAPTVSFAPTLTFAPSFALPTADPTAKPTADPTAKPTADPTAKPTADPTAKPTADPTAKPTADPTAKPTADPTAKPTADPTAKTLAPSPSPVAFFTGAPTTTTTTLSSPTGAPTSCLLSVTEPVAGRYSVPATFDVSWTADSCIGDTATIELCRVDANGDVTGDCVEIEVDVPDDGSFEDALLAAMPPAGAGPYVVKVSDPDNPDVFAFSEVVELCSLAVAEPKAGSYTVPATFDVVWDKDSCIGDRATIEICPVDEAGDVSGACEVVAVDVPDGGSLQDAIQAALPASGEGPYRIKVSDPANPDVFAYSEIIELCELKVTSPSGDGLAYDVPVAVPVTWEADACVGDRIQISLCPAGAPRDPACVVVDFDGDDATDNDGSEDVLLAVLPPAGAGSYQFVISDQANPDVFGLSPVFSLGDVCVKCLQNRDCAGSSVCVAPASRRRLMFGHFSAEGCCSVG